MTDYTDLLARGIPVYSLEGQYDWWGMVNVQTDETTYEGSGYWVKAEDAAAAIAALTAERDALREAIINRLHHYDEATGEDRCGCGACEPLFAALTAPKGE